MAHLFNYLAHFYGTPWFIALFCRASHWAVIWVRWVQSTSLHLMSLRFISILSSCLSLSRYSVRFKELFQVSKPCVTFPNMLMFYDAKLLALYQSPAGTTTLFRLSASAYSVYSLPKSAPCRGDKGPSHMVTRTYNRTFINVIRSDIPSRVAVCFLGWKYACC